MGAYTWTFVRTDKLTPEQVKWCINHAVWSSNGGTYGDYSKMTEKQYVKEWLKMHKEDYDYFVNECGVPPEHMTDEYLTEDIKNRMKQWHYRQECYQKCLDSSMSFEDMLIQTNQYDDGISDFYIIKRNGHYYVEIYHEIFRNYEYCDDEFHTVDSLIEHCRNCQGAQFLDFAKEHDDYHEWNDEIEQHVREYYEAIGDDNFYVHFG